MPVYKVWGSSLDKHFSPYLKIIEMARSRCKTVFSLGFSSGLLTLVTLSILF